MGEGESSLERGRNKIKQGRVKRGKRETDELARLSRMILAEARKIAKMEVQKAAIEVLSEATIIARWEKNPFYIT